MRAKTVDNGEYAAYNYKCFGARRDSSPAVIVREHAERADRVKFPNRRYSPDDRSDRRKTSLRP